MSVTIALAEANNCVHAGVVVTATKILPGWNFSKSAGLFSTQAGAVTTPGLVPMPVNTIFPSFFPLYSLYSLFRILYPVLCQ